MKWIHPVKIYLFNRLTEEYVNFEHSSIKTTKISQYKIPVLQFFIDHIPWNVMVHVLLNIQAAHQRESKLIGCQLWAKFRLWYYNQPIMIVLLQKWWESGTALYHTEPWNKYFMLCVAQTIMICHSISCFTLYISTYQTIKYVFVQISIQNIAHIIYPIWLPFLLSIVWENINSPLCLFMYTFP